NLTPDEIQNLLFNVDCSLEIPIDDFNENWWPLITNIWIKWISYKHVNGDVWKVITYCLMKFQKSNIRQKENVPIHYKNPNHAHLLLKYNRIKHPQVIQVLVKKKAIKNYTPPAITSAVRKYAMKELNLSISVNELK
ncbi:hypothetical protein RhiirA4_477560, partial [Rhizophagus irregularis]